MRCMSVCIHVFLAVSFLRNGFSLVHIASSQRNVLWLLWNISGEGEGEMHSVVSRPATWINNFPYTECVWLWLWLWLWVHVNIWILVHFSRNARIKCEICLTILTKKNNSLYLIHIPSIVERIVLLSPCTNERARKSHWNKRIRKKTKTKLCSTANIFRIIFSYCYTNWMNENKNKKWKRKKSTHNRQIYYYCTTS